MRFTILTIWSVCVGELRLVACAFKVARRIEAEVICVVRESIEITRDRSARFQSDEGILSDADLPTYIITSLLSPKWDQSINDL